MELLAVFIRDHFLFDKPEFLNFGGAFSFNFKLKDNELTIEKTDNPNFINNFFGNKISNISAIVGNNGVGKTSIMKVLNQEPKHELISIYLEKESIIVNNQSEIKVIADFDYEGYKDVKELFPLYYSSHIDYNLKSVYSPINQSNLIDDSIEDYHYESLRRQLFFLNRKGQVLQSNFKELPYYENLVIKVNNVDKSKFLDSKFYKNSNTGKSITEQLKMLWNYYSISNETMIHGDFGFIANFEVFIMSLLVSDDTFAETNSNGYSISFQDVLNQDAFEDKLIVFLKKRLVNIDGPLYESLEESIGVSFKNADKIIAKINAYKFSKIAGGFDFGKMKEHSILTIKRYLAIIQLYRFISNNADKTFIFEQPNEIKISVKQDASENFLETFIKLYQNVQESLQYIQFEFRIFNIFPEKRLSTGEQSLLNFYSAIYSFVRKGEHHLRKHNQYLLLLDEPETGYHAVWKKKFIKSITEILPELFKELKQNPSIQVIFSTHDALTLSDIPNDNITYLQKLEDSNVRVYKINEEGRPSKSFAANITDLLADSFFVEKGLLGDFAKMKIQEVLDNLNFKILTLELKELRENPTDANSSISISKLMDFNKLKGNFITREKKDIKSVIDIIDEPILRFKMDEMFYQAFPNEIDKDEAIKNAKRILGNAGLNISDLNQES